MISYRKATPEDVDDITKFIDKSSELFYTKRTIRRIVCGEGGRKPYDVTIARDGLTRELIGISVISSKSKTLSLLFVSPEYRGKGIGTELYRMSKPKQILVKSSALGFFARCERQVPP